MVFKPGYIKLLQDGTLLERVNEKTFYPLSSMPP